MPLSSAPSSSEATLTQRRPTPVSAILMVVAAMACFSTSDALAKFLTGMLPVAVIVWVRYLAFLIMLVPLLRRGRGVLRTRHAWLHGVRALALASSATFFILALRVLPMAEATALVFASPLFVTLLSAWLLDERVDAVRWLIVVAGFAGVIVVMRPGSAVFRFEALLPVCSSVAWAVSVICTRKLTVHDGVDTTLVYSGLLGFALVSLVALPQLTLPPVEGMIAAVSMAVIWSGAQWLSVHAYHRGNVSVLAPFSYSQLLWSTLIGITVFGHLPDGASLLGIGTILGCGVVAMWWSTRDELDPERPG
jgi:drug/metabolite transporter (DMT)-like permease